MDQSAARTEGAIDLLLSERFVGRMDAEQHERVALLDARGDLRERLLNWRGELRLGGAEQCEEEIAQR